MLMSSAYLKVHCVQGTISYQKWATMKARPALTALMAILNVGGIINWKWAKQRLSRIYPCNCGATLLQMLHHKNVSLGESVKEKINS